ncbi:M61 family metallopeptidase [Salegentibacter chungangensis]|uniref:Peptidase M61 n=1 Tax=Salegentibacter chungangensis TaxID=1335724 RepID=A0ABW3NUU0_9FLAO
MKKLIVAVAAIATLYGCKTAQTGTDAEQPIIANLDLVNINEDRVSVSVDPDKIAREQITFFIPKTVPGTYSTDNYGKFIDDFKALDYKGKELKVTKIDDNSWQISDAKNLDKVTYLVNDTFDIKGEEDVFSPTGTNINEGENFMLNLHGFVGYFDQLKEKNYRLVIKRPLSLIPGTSLTAVTKPQDSETYTTDVYNVDRYFQVTDHPIMYAAPDTTKFMVDNMEVLIDVYSPNKKYTAKSITPGIKEMISAQKNFLGDIDNTDKYAILLYLSDIDTIDARGFGALEHHTSTAVVLPESMPAEALQKTMTDVVSHEFFHILTPLSVHSNEIHYFDYNDPKMSKHLWMYEGVTEYFANLFQINQGLISNEDFYKRIADKIKTSQNYDDTVPFTEMSENVLADEYKDSYYNVYQKGALIGMALDIRLRELSNGEMGILDLMKKLSDKYGKDRPFDDDKLIDDIVELTYPEIQNFFEAYVSGHTPIPYDQFFNKVGLQQKEFEKNTGYFLHGNIPYIDADPATKEIFFRKGITFNSFLKELGVKGGDILKSVNGKEYNVENIYGLVMTAESWEEGTEVSFVVERDGEEITLEASTFQPTEPTTGIVEKDLPEDSAQVKLRQAWLKG